VVPATERLYERPTNRGDSNLTEREIQLFVPNYRTEECLEEIRECLEKGWTGLGFKTLAFEKEWISYTGLPHAHFVASATAGLHLAIKMLKEKYGWQDGDEVITTPLTFVSTNHAILYEELKPVFADVDQYLCLDPTSLRQRITDRTKAVMFVGLGGNTGQLEQVVAICQEHGLKLILDCAHMTGTRVHGKHVGAEGDVSVFSFHSVKNLPTADGGMICFKDQELDQECRKWTWLGINKDTYQRTASDSAYKWRYDVEHVGYKYHGNSIMAALGLVAIKYIDIDNAFRRQISTWYDSLLDKNIERVPVAGNCESSRHLYQVMVDHRDQVLLELNNRKIYPGVHYADNTNYRMYAEARGTCPRAHQASERLLSLPLHTKLTYQDVARVAAALNESCITKRNPAAVSEAKKQVAQQA
jgi:dTDP-4-amino-4,6-dideoxygalactose transaminase